MTNILALNPYFSNLQCSKPTILGNKDNLDNWQQVQSRLQQKLQKSRSIYEVIQKFMKIKIIFPQLIVQFWNSSYPNKSSITGTLRPFYSGKVIHVILVIDFLVSL